MKSFQDFLTELKDDQIWFENEYWRRVPGYEGQYIVSESGKVFRLAHVAPRKHRYRHGAKSNYKFSELLMRHFITKRQGYHNIVLKGVKFPVHRLVAMAWHPNPNNKPHVNHIDHNKSNNHYSNLEWCTAKENVHHSLRAGKYDGHNAKLSYEQVRRIKATPLNISSSKVATMYNISSSVIRHIRQGKTWKHV